MTHNYRQLLSLYQRVEAATTRKEVKAILAEAEHLRQAATAVSPTKHGEHS